MIDLRAALLDMLADMGIEDITEPTRLGGGSSQENWAFDAWQSGPDGRAIRKLLMRRDPESGVVETSRRMEFDLLAALGSSGLPVARVHAFDDGSRLERVAMVVDRLSGSAHRSVLRDKDPLKLGNTGRMRVATALPDLLADVHRVDITAPEMPAVIGEEGGDPAVGELARWTSELDRVELEPQPALREVIAWLQAHVPAPPPRRTLVHGDFRPANVLVDGGKVEALLDWELAHSGDPHDDLGWYTCSVYRAEHFIDPDWTQEKFLERWSSRSGIAVEQDRLHFWQVMSTLRLAVMALTAVRGFCAGATDRPSGPADRVIGLALKETGLLTTRTASSEGPS